MKSLIPEDVEKQLQAAIERGDYDVIMRHGSLLDSLDKTRQAVSLVSAALWYAEQGLHVFPLTPRAKTPLPKSHGCKDATSDAAQIRDWWRTTPDANVGIATGHLVDVIDIDGPAGVKIWAQIYDSLPPILGVVGTPRAGGNHLYVACDQGGNSAALAPGVDYRGAGGYVVAPPSVNSEGVTYTWMRPLITPLHDSTH